MVHANQNQLQADLERQVMTRTGRRLRDLSIEMQPERIVLRGLAVSYYVKQLAQQGVREMLPNICLENAIVVDS